MKSRSSSRRSLPRSSESVAANTVRNLAGFRYSLRKFLRLSENAARQCGLTPQQHQLLLGIAGHTGRGYSTVSELAEFLQEQRNSAVQLVGRAMQRGLVRKKQDTRDRRFVFVSLTARGTKILSKLAGFHKEEFGKMHDLLSASFTTPARGINLKKGDA